MSRAAISTDHPLEAPPCSGLRPARDGGNRGRGWAAGFTLLGLALSAWMGFHSDGVHHDDDLKHLQIARWAGEYPQYLLDDWGRPGFTVLYAPVARAGWLTARLQSGLLTALTAWLAYLIAARQGIRLAPLVPALLWLQPLTLTLSHTTLTETPLAFYLTAAAWLYVRGNFAWSAAVISLSAVTRHEAALFLLCWLAALLYRRRPLREWIWLVWAPVLHNLLSLVFLHAAPLALFLRPSPTAEYGSGTWLTMLTRWAVAAGVGPLLLALGGLPSIWRRPGGGLWVGCALAYFLAHAVIYRFGLFASGGYFRFLVPLGPVVALAAAETLSQAWAALRPSGNHAGGDGPPQRIRPWLWPLVGGVILLWLAGELELARYGQELARYGFEWTKLALRGLMGLLAAVGGLALVVSGAVESRAGRAARARTADPEVGRYRAPTADSEVGRYSSCETPFADTTQPPLGAKRAWLRVVAVSLLPGVLLVVAIVQPLVVSRVAPAFRQCAPLVLTDRERAYRDAVDWLRRYALEGRSIVAAMPWFDEFLRRSRPPTAPDVRSAFARMRPGDVLLWDSRECAAPRYALRLDELRRRADLVELWHSCGGAGDPVYCAVFEKWAPAGSRPANDDAR